MKVKCAIREAFRSRTFNPEHFRKLSDLVRLIQNVSGKVSDVVLLLHGIYGKGLRTMIYNVWKIVKSKVSRSATVQTHRTTVQDRYMTPNDRISRPYDKPTVRLWDRTFQTSRHKQVLNFSPSAILEYFAIRNCPQAHKPTVRSYKVAKYDRTTVEAHRTIVRAHDIRPYECTSPQHTMYECTSSTYTIVQALHSNTYSVTIFRWFPMIFYISKHIPSLYSDFFNVPSVIGQGFLILLKPLS